MKQQRLLCLALICTLFSCGRNSSAEADFSAASDTTSITGLTGDSVKLVKTAGIQMKVNNAQETVRSISTLAQSLGGIITRQNITAVDNGTRELPISNDSVQVISAYTTQAEIIIKIPEQNLESFLYKATELGYYTTNSHLSIDDKSLGYLLHHVKKIAREDYLQKNAGKVMDASRRNASLAVQDELSKEDYAKRQIDADVRFSTVQLYLEQNPMIRKEVRANHDLTSYHLPFGKSMRIAFASGWTYFLNFVLFVAHFWMFILLALMAWVATKYYKERKAAGVI